MKLPQHTVNGFKNYLKLFFMAIDNNKPMSRELKQRLALCEREIADGTIQELSFENLINALINELNEHMFVWKIVAKARASHFINRGASFLILVTAPDLKSCIKDVVNYKFLFLPESFAIRFYTRGEKIIFEVTEQGQQSPLPHIKFDTAIGMALFHFREVVGVDFDYDEIFIPNDRPNFEPKVIASTSKAKIIRDNGPMRASFDKNWLSVKNAFYNETLRNQVKSQLESLLEEFKDEDSLTSQVSKLIKQAEGPASLSQEKVADLLNYSISTFRRKLADENTSYKILLNKILDEVCIDSLISSDIKIDALALKLGYAERSTFERAFRNKFGTTPAKFREFRERLIDNDRTLDIDKVIGSLGPLPESCIQLIEQADNSSLDLEQVVAIVNRDPLFSGRIMGLASKALYGSSPDNLNQAIGRNLGLDTVKNLAVVYAAQDSLEKVIHNIDLERFISASSMAPRIFRHLTRNIKELEYSVGLMEQCLLFGLLGGLVLCHQNFTQSNKVTDCFNQSEDFYQFLETIYQEFNLPLFGTSALLLSHWGIDNEVIKIISQLDRTLSENRRPQKLEQLIMFTFAVSLAVNFEQNAHQTLLENADIIGISAFEDKWNQFIEGL